MTDTLETMTLPLLSNQPNVEIAQTGTWNLSTGEVTLTMDDLANAIAAMDCPAVRNPVLKLGHQEPMPDAKKMRWDGTPAVGYVANMGLTDSGNTIVGDYEGMPGWLGPILPSAYPDRSMEATWDFTCQLGHVHPLVITAVALLGETPPGIGTLESLQDVANLYGVQASMPVSNRGFSVEIQAKGVQMPSPRPVEIAAGVTAEDVKRKYYETAAYSIWIKEFELDPLQMITIDEATGDYARVPVTVNGDEFEFGDPVAVKVEYVDAPATAAASSRITYASKNESRPASMKPRTETERTPVEAIQRVHKASVSETDDQRREPDDMDSARIRKELGLASDASDDDVYAAIAASRQTSPTPPTPAPSTEPEQDSTPASVAATGPVPEGAVILDAAIVRRLQEDAAQGVEAMKVIQKNRRDDVIASAIQAGKFPPARKEHYETLWAGDPVGTEDHINKLGAGLVPLEASGYPGTESFEQDQMYFGLYPEEMPKGASR